MSNADETAHQIREYRVNAARMRAIGKSVRSPAMREQFEQLARKLEILADQQEALGDPQCPRPTEHVH